MITSMFAFTCHQLEVCMGRFFSFSIYTWSKRMFFSPVVIRTNLSILFDTYFTSFDFSLVPMFKAGALFRIYYLLCSILLDVTNFIFFNRTKNYL